MLPLAPPAACISHKRLLFEDAAISTKDYEMDQPPTVISSSTRLYHKHLYVCISFCKRKYNIVYKIKFLSLVIGTHVFIMKCLLDMIFIFKYNFGINVHNFNSFIIFISNENSILI